MLAFFNLVGAHRDHVVHERAAGTRLQLVDFDPKAFRPPPGFEALLRRP
jgi:hypothetical protein